MTVDAVMIGRNEGARLMACLASLHGQVGHVVYVDSGSTDGSVAAARAAGAEVVELDMSLPFTAARARNAGLRALESHAPDFVQFVDGDCVLQADWIGAALAAFARNPSAVVVCGRRRERFPEASIYNAMADLEWNTPVGETLACGGDALMRFAAVHAVGGFRDGLIAGEEPELCLRLRRQGGRILRIDAEMTMHDAALLRFGQWWTRMVRSGHAFAEGAALHGAGPERHWVAQTRRAVLWGAVGPLVIVAAALIYPLCWTLALVYPAQVVRLSLRQGPTWAFLTVVGRFAEAQGALGFYVNRLLGRRRGLIEYK